MNDTFSYTNMIRDGEFHAATNRIEDKRTRAFLRFGYTQALYAAGSGAAPTAPFDLEFFAKVLERMFAKKQVIETVLAGDLAAAGLDPDDPDAFG